MDQQPRGLSQKQQNDCRAALGKFIDRHELFDWEMEVDVQETTPGKYCVQIGITPPSKSGFPTWPVQEFAMVDASFDIAAKVYKLLGLGLQARFPERTMQLIQ